MKAINVVLIILVVLFGIGVLAEKDKEVAYRLLAGLAICIAGLVVLQIFVDQDYSIQHIFDCVHYHLYILQ